MTQLIPPKPESNFKLCPAGNFVATCYSMIHIGTVKEEYQGQIKEIQKVQIRWELPTETEIFNEEKGVEPFAISQEYTYSMHEKARLRKVLESWRGKAFTEEEAESFDISKLIGVPCTLNVIHKTSQSTKNTYATVSAVTPIMKGMEVPSQVNGSITFSVNDFNQQLFDSFPEFLQDRIKSSKEYQTLFSNDVTSQVTEDEDDDLPF